MRVFNRVSRFIGIHQEKRIIYAMGHLDEQRGDLFGLATTYTEPFPRPAVFIPSLVIYGKPGKLSGSAIHLVNIMVARDATLDGRRGKVVVHAQAITTRVQGDGELNGYPGTVKGSALAFEAQVAKIDLGVFFSAGGNTGTNVLEFSMNYPLRSNPISAIAHEAALHLSLFTTTDSTLSKIQIDNSLPLPLPHVTCKTSALRDHSGDSIQLPISVDWSGIDSRLFTKTIQVVISAIPTAKLQTSVAPEVEFDPCWLVSREIPKIYHEGLPDLFLGPRSPLARGLLSYLYPGSPDTTLSVGFWSNIPPTVRTRKGRVYDFDGSHYLRHFLYPPIPEEWSVFIRFKPMTPPGSDQIRYLWEKITDDQVGSVDIYSAPNADSLTIWRGPEPPLDVPLSVPSGEWHTLGVSFQCPKEDTQYRDDPIIVFLNGKKLTVSLGDFECPVVDATGEVPTSELMIGRNFIGYISTVCYWQRALSVRELRVLAYDLFPADNLPVRHVLE